MGTVWVWTLKSSPQGNSSPGNRRSESERTTLRTPCRKFLAAQLDFFEVVHRSVVLVYCLKNDKGNNSVLFLNLTRGVSTGTLSPRF